MMPLPSPGRLAIHRRSDEIAFLQNRLRALDAAYAAAAEREPNEVLMRERDLADELLHTRQIEPLGETLQRRLAMAERICRELAPQPKVQGPQDGDPRDARSQVHRPETYWVAEVERQALASMLEQWWAWLRES